jgi:RimJ/RimL family protein N-acetyltransferase
MMVLRRNLSDDLGQFTLREPSSQADYALIWQWWNARHVRGRWAVDFRLGAPDPGAKQHTQAQLERYLHDLRAAQQAEPKRRDLLRAFIGAVDDVDACYLEVYGVSASPLLGLPGLDARDRGMHLIIGSMAHLGKGLAGAIGRVVLHWQFCEHPEAQCFVLDPSARNALAIRVAKDASHGLIEEIGDVRLPHKVASVLALRRSAYEAHLELFAPRAAALA